LKSLIVTLWCRVQHSGEELRVSLKEWLGTSRNLYPMGRRVNATIRRLGMFRPLNHGSRGITGMVCLCHEAKLGSKEDHLDCQALCRSLRWICIMLQNIFQSVISITRNSIGLRKNYFEILLKLFFDHLLHLLPIKIARY
jgi:hypothetical protein